MRVRCGSGLRACVEELTFSQLPRRDGTVRRAVSLEGRSLAPLTQKIACAPGVRSTALRSPEDALRSPELYPKSARVSKLSIPDPGAMAEIIRSAMAAAALLVEARAGFLHLAHHGTALTTSLLSSMVLVREVKKSGTRIHGRRPE